MLVVGRRWGTGACRNISVEFLLVHDPEDFDDLGCGERIASNHRHVEFGRVDQRVCVAMLDRGVTIEVRPVLIGVRHDVSNSDREVFEQQPFAV